MEDDLCRKCWIRGPWSSSGHSKLTRRFESYYKLNFFLFSGRSTLVQFLKAATSSFSKPIHQTPAVFRSKMRSESQSYFSRALIEVRNSFVLDISSTTTIPIKNCAKIHQQNRCSIKWQETSSHRNHVLPASKSTGMTQTGMQSKSTERQEPVRIIKKLMGWWNSMKWECKSHRTRTAWWCHPTKIRTRWQWNAKITSFWFSAQILYWRIFDLKTILM